MDLLFTGDYFVSDEFKGQNLIDTSILKLFQEVDYRVVNLETPVTGNNPQNRILKTGPHLRSSPAAIFPMLKQLRVDLVSLANNHIMDYGSTGLADTIAHCNNNAIPHVGVGQNITDSAEPFILERYNQKIAFLNFTENEWSIAESDKPGANPLDIIDNLNQIKLAGKVYDKVIVIIHGGHEYYHLPSPRMVKQYRFYAENGADAIICHHTHCIGGYEVYNNVPIFYSLGNFLFTKRSIYEAWYTGFVLKLKIIQHKSIGFELYPVRQDRQQFIVKLLEEREKDLVLEEVNRYNIIINDSTLLNQHWNHFLDIQAKQYLNFFSPVNLIRNRYIRGILNRMSLNRYILKKRYLKLILNVIRCEAHSDAAKLIISEYLGDI